ncbi:recombinase family protein, partial (plasmid) [Enterobacter roggenkampii]|uniref:recombinase family protein n=1 Tax=Enterobacter roggenkampii TaxID=1812935 RepID=UPI0032AE96F0
CGWDRENISGTQLERPQLNKLLHDAGPGVVLLVEKLDRLSRLTRSEWEQLKERSRAKRLRIVCCDIPTTLAVLLGEQPTGAGGFDVRNVVLDALNSMLLDIAAAWARDD